MVDGPLCFLLRFWECRPGLLTLRWGPQSPPLTRGRGRHTRQCLLSEDGWAQAALWAPPAPGRACDRSLLSYC